MVNSKFKLAIVILWNKNIHGEIHDNEFPSEEQLSKYFINDTSISIDEFYDKRDYKEIKNYLKLIKNEISDKVNENIFDEYYNNIFINLLNKKVIGIQIVEQIEVNDYAMCIIKTHWVRLIQRRWRKIRNKRINSKKKISNLRHREMYGKFPNSCNVPFRLGI
jgi:hypothetical protein